MLTTVAGSAGYLYNDKWWPEEGNSVKLRNVVYVKHKLVQTDLHYAGFRPKKPNFMLCFLGNVKFLSEITVHEFIRFGEIAFEVEQCKQRKVGK
jgi:hypothetical protein